MFNVLSNRTEVKRECRNSTYLLLFCPRGQGEHDPYGSELL
jgi:hypothetical protein